MEQEQRREMTPLGHDGPAPYGVRYRLAGGPIRERFFISDSERAKWVDARVDDLDTLSWYNPT